MLGAVTSTQNYPSGMKILNFSCSHLPIVQLPYCRKMIEEVAPPPLLPELLYLTNDFCCRLQNGLQMICQVFTIPHFETHIKIAIAGLGGK